MAIESRVELTREESSIFLNSSQCKKKCDIRHVDKTKKIKIKCDCQVATNLMDRIMKTGSFDFCCLLQY